MSGKFVMTHGVPGCGKSTWANEQKANDPENIVIVERDEIRLHLFGPDYSKGSPQKQKENQVNQIQEQLIKSFLSEGKTVIVSDTNLNGRVVSRLKKIAEERSAPVSVQSFDVPPEVCRKRNRERGARGGRFVPDRVMDQMIEKSYANGHLKRMILSRNGVFYVEQHSPNAKKLADFNERLAVERPFLGKSIVLVDVDGTLANNAHCARRFLHSGNRKDFAGFYRSISTSPVNETVRDLANRMRDEDQLSLVVLTGREDSAVDELISFVERSGLKASRLICKNAGDGRPDDEFKTAVLSKMKEEGLIPVHAFDDRESSVRTMEKHGIMVSRVETPTFSNDADLTVPAPEPAVNTVYGSGYCIRCGSLLKSGGNIGPTCRTKI